MPKANKKKIVKIITGCLSTIFFLGGAFLVYNRHIPQAEGARMCGWNCPGNNYADMTNMTGCRVSEEWKCNDSDGGGSTTTTTGRVTTKCERYDWSYTCPCGRDGCSTYNRNGDCTMCNTVGGPCSPADRFVENWSPWYCSDQCNYIDRVDSWTACVNGRQTADSVHWASIPGTSCSDTVALTNSCAINGACAWNHYNCATGSLGGTAEYWNQYQWWCVGSGGGSNILCAEPKVVNGACTATHYGCAAGSLGGTAEYGDQFQWWCNGANGGGSVLCAEAKPMMGGVNVACNAAGTQATVSWSAQNATSYAIRLDKDSASWNPQSCNQINLGDLCRSYGINSVVVDTIPGNPNNFWVHACNASIGCNWNNFGQNVFACYAPPTSLTITGPTTGNVNTTYVFTAKATDPQNSNITYKFIWGDGGTQSNSPPAASGTPVSLPHSWTTSGSKTISVTACNSFGLCSAPATLNILISNCAATNPAWSECTQSCGNEGTQTRSVLKTDCLIDNQTQACNRVDCPQWKEVIP